MNDGTGAAVVEATLKTLTCVDGWGDTAGPLVGNAQAGVVDPIGTALLTPTITSGLAELDVEGRPGNEA